MTDELDDLTRDELIERARQLPPVADRVTTRMRKAELVELVAEGLEACSGQPVPERLGEAGRAVWTAITSVWVLDPREAVLLEAACRTADDVRELEEAVAEEGMTLRGSKGQPTLNRKVTEARQGRLAISRLLGDLDLPDPADQEGGEPSGGTFTSQRASRAAAARWSGVATGDERGAAGIPGGG